ncbi:MAG TPA: GAF and ANTAR domain-containing protein [Propionibacteriaceae bacterium]|nr:GAF and ANTAR domain-containing protein [Propionibacteriaceae bacterium]
MNLERYTESLAEFARTLTGRSEISDVLHDLAERLPTVLDITGAGVCLPSGEGVSFATANSETVAALEQVQEACHVGPCLDAIRSKADVLVADLSDEAERWPDYVAAAQRLGIVALAALPLLSTRDLGVLDLYDTRVHQWTAEELQTARVFADIAAGYLLSASDLERERRTVEQLKAALDSRVVIEQAKGIIAQANSSSVDEAFLRLRKFARDHRANLREVAQAVVSLGLRL